MPSPALHTLPEIATHLHRPLVYLHGLQERFELPVFEGAAYSDAYADFLRKLVYLRALSIPEKLLRDLWHLEKKLLQLLHADSNSGSQTWFLDACGQTSHPKRRLLLSDYDLGVDLPSGSLQLGLDFEGEEGLPELFAVPEKELRKELGDLREDVCVERVNPSVDQIGLSVI